MVPKYLIFGSEKILPPPHLNPETAPGLGPVLAVRNRGRLNGQSSNLRFQFKLPLVHCEGVRIYRDCSRLFIKLKYFGLGSLSASLKMFLAPRTINTFGDHLHLHFTFRSYIRLKYVVLVFLILNLKIRIYGVTHKG